MRSDYTGEELDAIEKLTDSNAYAQGYGWQDNGEWESVICKLYGIIQNKRANEFIKRIEALPEDIQKPIVIRGDNGEPLQIRWSDNAVYCSDDTISPMGDLHGHIVVDDDLHPAWLTDGGMTNEETKTYTIDKSTWEGQSFGGPTGATYECSKYSLKDYGSVEESMRVLSAELMSMSLDVPDAITEAIGSGLNDYTEPEPNTLIADRHLGRFRVDFDIIEKTPHYVINSAMSNFLIVRAESLYHMHAIEYMAYSELFEPTDPACEPPFYMVSFSDDGEVSAEKSGWG